MSAAPPLLISVVELGDYANYTPLYQRLGYRVESVNTGRKAIGLLKKQRPDAVVTEFNYQFSFRDRTSNLESILAVVQSQDTRVVVFYDLAVQAQLDLVAARFPGFIALPYPIDDASLAAALS